MAGPKYRWVILFLAYFLMLGFAFGLQSLPPIIPVLIKHMRLSHTQVGLLMSLYSLPTIFLALPAGRMSDRFGPLRTGAGSAAVLTLGTLIFATSGTYTVAALGRLIAGVGAVALSIVAAQLVSQWFREGEVGTAMGFFNTGMPFGTIVCFAAFGKLGESYGWRLPIFATAVIGFLALTFLLLLYRPAPVLPQTTNHKDNSSLDLWRNLRGIHLSVWLVGLSWLFFNAALISFSTFAPDFFVAQGFSLGTAGLLTSLLMWGSLVFSPLVGRLLDKFQNNEVFIGTGGLLVAVAIFLVTRSTNFLFPMILLALAVPFVPSSTFAFISKLLEPQVWGLGFGILSMATGTGLFIGPYLAGVIRDKTGSYQMSFMFLAALALLVTVTAIFLRISLRRPTTRL